MTVLTFTADHNGIYRSYRTKKLLNEKDYEGLAREPKIPSPQHKSVSIANRDYSCVMRVKSHMKNLINPQQKPLIRKAC